MSNASANEELARNVRRLRVAARVSLSELGRNTGVGKATLSAIENGRGNPTVETLAALAVALGVDVVDLLGPPSAPRVSVTRRSAGEDVGDGLVRLARLSAGALHVLALAAHELVEAAPRVAGSRVHVVVTRGTLVTGPAEVISELGAGDCASFPGDVAHVFRTGRRAAEAVVVVEEPRG